MLLPSIAEVVEEGHKVLVFSQFTSFLAIVRERLDQEQLVYEYLDGRTRNRAAKVERFQTDPDCPIFLISLKAGGLGLNLTAAEYVYLLDPWWNPAVEAQAIDRSHRIGQTQHVFAYRLICRGTVEEKILELQQKKRDLADAILNADNRVISRTSPARTSSSCCHDDGRPRHAAQFSTFFLNDRKRGPESQGTHDHYDRVRKTPAARPVASVKMGGPGRSSVR